MLQPWVMVSYHHVPTWSGVGWPRNCSARRHGVTVRVPRPPAGAGPRAAARAVCAACTALEVPVVLPDSVRIAACLPVAARSPLR